MYRYVSSFFLALMILTGCEKSVEDEIQNGKTINSIEEKVTEGIDTTIINADETTQENINKDEIKAMRDAQEFIEVIKDKNVEKLRLLLDDPLLQTEGIKKIIEGFEGNFDLNTLSVHINYDGFAMNPSLGQYEFNLTDMNSNEDNGENSLIIFYKEDGDIVYHNSYVRYFPYAEAMVTNYLDLIKKEKTNELASFLNPDDIEVPIWVAEDVIKNYKDYSDEKNISLQYLRKFIFVIKNAEGNEHVIEVIYGDGLMNIKDDFIPDFDF